MLLKKNKKICEWLSAHFCQAEISGLFVVVYLLLTCKLWGTQSRKDKVLFFPKKWSPSLSLRFQSYIQPVFILFCCTHSDSSAAHAALHTRQVGRQTAAVVRTTSRQSHPWLGSVPAESLSRPFHVRKISVSIIDCNSASGHALPREGGLIWRHLKSLK